VLESTSFRPLTYRGFLARPVTLFNGLRPKTTVGPPTEGSAAPWEMRRSRELVGHQPAARASGSRVARNSVTIARSGARDPKPNSGRTFLYYTVSTINNNDAETWPMGYTAETTPQSIGGSEVLLRNCRA